MCLSGMLSLSHRVTRHNNLWRDAQKLGGKHATSAVRVGDWHATHVARLMNALDVTRPPPRRLALHSAAVPRYRAFPVR